MPETVLFLSNNKFISKTKLEGGVSVCTQEYISLIKQVYEIALFHVECRKDLIYRIRVKLGLNIYHDYNPQKSISKLFSLIDSKKIKYVFLNLSNTMEFSLLLKEKYGSRIKIVLCSHGNESGDYLHAITRFNTSTNIINSIIDSYVLGAMLKKEHNFRQKYIDYVLTVSPIEASLENWIGAKKVMMIPRTITANEINWNPIAGRIGFIGDLSHDPNLHGIRSLCDVLKQKGIKHLEIRLVGNPEAIGNKLCKDYSFIKYLGYLDNNILEDEITTWSYFLNPVFYFSRGVSTKMAKAIGWGLPVISTTIGCRGYSWVEGNVIIAETPDEMIDYLINTFSDPSYMYNAKINVNKILDSAPTVQTISKDLIKFLGDNYE